MKNLSKFLAIPALALTLIPTNVFAASETAGVKVNIPESLTLSLSTDNLTFNLEDTDLHTDKLTVTAKTNAASGYTISFNANNDYNDLKHANVLVEDKIASIAEDKTEETFPETAWAYSTDLEDYTFKKIPLTPENVFATTEKGENNHDFTIGVRANNLAAGDYENELIFTAVANPGPSLTLANITTMQEITPEIVAATPEHESKQLVDVRDNKSYWVTKLKDGNIWMTQNLDYDLSVTANQTLTPETSNVKATRVVVPTITDLAGFSDYSMSVWAIAYYDNGDKYFVDGITAEDGYSALPEDSELRHYAQGDFYSWNAATAGQGDGNFTEGDIEESICPAGWRLPTSESENSKYDYVTLLDKYGNPETDDVMRAEPLYFARSSNAIDQWEYGHYWTATASEYSLAGRFLISDEVVMPNAEVFRNAGLTMRCVAL